MRHADAKKTEFRHLSRWQELNGRWTDNIRVIRRLVELNDPSLNLEAFRLIFKGNTTASKTIPAEIL